MAAAISKIPVMFDIDLLMTQASSFALRRTQRLLRFLSQAIDIHKCSFDSGLTRYAALERCDQRLHVPRPVVADPVNKKCGRAVHSASHPAEEICPHTFTIAAFLQRARESFCIQSQLFREH